MIYVMSDIHGQKRRFDSVMRQIGLRAEDTLYVLGDVIDRNPDGIGILRRIMAMPNARMLLGNHELMMMNALYYPPPADEDCPGSYYERKQALLNIPPQGCGETAPCGAQPPLKWCIHSA